MTAQRFTKKKFLQLPVRNSAGVTLIELMITILVIAIIVSFAVPSMYGFLDKQSVVAQAKRFKTSIEYARNEAIARIEDVVICASDGNDNNPKCSGSDNWDNGWLIYIERVDDPGTDPDTLTGACLPTEDCLLKVENPVPSTWTLRGDESWIGFSGIGDRDSGSGTDFRLCGAEAEAANDTDVSRTVIINPAGGSHMSVGAATCP